MGGAKISDFMLLGALMVGWAAHDLEAQRNLDRSPFNWSPDGEHLTFQAAWDGDNEIYVIRRDGTGLRQITQNSTNDRHPIFALDGESILFSSAVTRLDGSSDLDIFTVDAEGGEPRRLFGERGARIVQHRPPTHSRASKMR